MRRPAARIVGPAGEHEDEARAEQRRNGHARDGFDKVPIRPTMRDDTATKKKPKMTIRRLTSKPTESRRAAPLDQRRSDGQSNGAKGDPGNWNVPFGPQLAAGPETSAQFAHRVANGRGRSSAASASAS